MKNNDPSSINKQFTSKRSGTKKYLKHGLHCQTPGLDQVPSDLYKHVYLKCSQHSYFSQELYIMNQKLQTGFIFTAIRICYTKPYMSYFWDHFILATIVWNLDQRLGEVPLRFELWQLDLESRAIELNLFTHYALSLSELTKQLLSTEAGHTVHQHEAVTLLNITPGIYIYIWVNI